MHIESVAAFGQSSGIYDFMNTSWGWPAVESLHFIALATLLGTVGLFDLRLLGLARGVPMMALHRLVKFGVVGYVVNVLTGCLFFVSAPDQYLYNPAFQLKLACMLVAGVNVMVFYSAPVKKLQQLGPEAAAPLPIQFIAGVSLASWLGVIVCGRLITMFRPPYHWCWWC